MTGFLNIAMIGAGRIGWVHARNIMVHPRTNLVAVADAIADAAQALASETGASVREVDAIFADETIDAVVVASPTDTHSDMILRATAAGKAVFCEKPIDLDLANARQTCAAVDATGVPVMMGFNRRFDPNFQALKAALDSGQIGKAEMLTLTSFDPGPPPVSYIARSGGLFKDMMIHDLNMVCWIMGGLPETVQAMGACLVDPAIAKAGDIDTALVTMRFADGRVAVVKNSRRAAHGYDQRIELLGSDGMLEAGNVLENTVIRSGRAGVVHAKPENFFLQRYHRAYEIAWDGFVTCVLAQTQPPVTARDGLNALLLAEIAGEALRIGGPVSVSDWTMTQEDAGDEQ